MTVYPRRGFLNTEFKIRTDEIEKFSIKYDEKIISEGVIKPGVVKNLPKFTQAGKYIITSYRTNQKQEITVEHALRLGSSELKKAYVFDNFPYIVFVMKDRIHIYDPTIEAYIYSENYLSPNEIRAINESKLLFITKHESGTSISVFDIETLSITAFKEFNSLIYQSLDFSRLFAISEDRCFFCVISTETLETIEIIELNEPKGENSIKIDEKKGLLYVVGKESIHSFDIKTEKEKIIKNKNTIGITENGYLITNSGTFLEYLDLDPSSNHSGRFQYKSEYRKSFYGFAIENKEWSSCGNTSTLDIQSILTEFRDECKAKKEAGEKSNLFSKTIDPISNKSISIELFPCEEGVYLVERITTELLQTMYYKVQQDRVTGNSIDQSIQLHWISNKNYEITYTTDQYYDCDLTICFTNDLAAFTLQSNQEYVLLKNGVIIESFTKREQITEKIHVKEDKPLEETIIVEGKEINSYSIICKSTSKCLCKENGKYIYYLCGPDGNWFESKFIELEELRHNSAKMSPDGKYLVYSKGRNQYALYNIEDQTEETVLTGNFVDFDKTGNLLFMEDIQGNPARHRELRIYDPKTFSWGKTFPEYYHFVSPDGKLYAKTALKVRYYDLINNIEITKDQYNKIIVQYYMDHSTKKDDKKRIISERKKCIIINKEYFESYAKKHNYAADWINLIHNENYHFEEFLVSTQQFIVIGIVGNNTELELKVGYPLSFLNYVAFSYDNRYVGIVGKPTSYGYLKLAQIKFDEINNTLSLKKDICDMVIAEKATWTCAFTRQGLFGTYDSKPNLYLIDQANFEQFTEEKTNDFGFLRDHFRIENRSLLCFSPSGKFMALSNQGYEAKSLGGRGHVPSNEVFIYSTDSKKMLAAWQDQGETIAFRTVSNAGFSIDETKLMTVSADGVIVVRYIHELIKTNSDEHKAAYMMVS